MVIQQRLGDRCARPDLHGAGALDLGAHPLHELPHREHQPVLLVQERRRPGQLQGLVPIREQPAEGTDARIGRAQGPGPAAGANGVQQIHDFLFRDGRGHRNLLGIKVREAGAQSAGACHDARDAKGKVIRALVAKHLRRRARHRGAFDRRCAVRVQEIARKRGQEPRRGRTEAHADNVYVHALALDLHGVFAGGDGARQGRFHRGDQF